MEPRHEVIRSRANAALKRARSVGRGKDAAAVLLEGERLVRDALEAGLRPELVLVREDQRAVLDAWQGAGLDPGSTRLVQGDLFDAVAALTTPPGVLAVMARPEPRRLASLGDVVGGAGHPALILGVAGVADPGNLGALARCAEAAGASALVVGPGGARPFGPKAVRGSMGSLLRVPVFEAGDLAGAVGALSALGVRQCLASTRGGEPIAGFDFGPRVCVWMTGETGEAPPELADALPLTIPMGGAVESLNVTVAGALMLFAAAGVMR